MTVLVRRHYNRTYLDAIRSLLVAVGVPAPATVDGATKNTLSAGEYVNTAAEIIWNWTDWPWKREPFFIDLIPEGHDGPGVWYPLPDDFAEIVIEPLAPYGCPRILYVEYETLMSAFPGFRFPTPDYQTEEMIEELDESVFFRGPPQFYTLYRDFMGFYPAPSAEYAEEIKKLVAHYVPVYRRMEEDGDPLPIAAELRPAHAALALGLYKQTYEHGDAQADQSRGYELIKRAVLRKSLYGQPQHNNLPRG